MLDPFQAEKPEDIERLKALQEHIHAEFIDHVKTCRGTRLSGGDLFNGDIWVGSNAVPTGLVDGVAHLVPKMKEVYGDKMKLRVYQQKRPFLGRFGASLLGDAISEVEDRAAFQRFGV